MRKSRSQKSGPVSEPGPDDSVSALNENVHAPIKMRSQGGSTRQFFDELEWMERLPQHIEMMPSNSMLSWFPDIRMIGQSGQSSRICACGTER